MRPRETIELAAAFEAILAISADSLHTQVSGNKELSEMLSAKMYGSFHQSEKVVRKFAFLGSHVFPCMEADTLSQALDDLGVLLSNFSNMYEN